MVPQLETWWLGEEEDADAFKSLVAVISAGYIDILLEYSQLPARAGATSTNYD